MFKYLLLGVAAFSAAPASAASAARDIEPIHRVLRAFRVEIDDLESRVEALQNRTVRVTMECVMGRSCQFAEPKAFPTRIECEKSISYSMVSSSVCVTSGY